MRGAAWAVAMRWGIRLLGLVNIAVIARILSPADFGLVAMAMAVVAFTTVLLDFGTEWAVLQNKHAGVAEFNTCWTIRLIQYAGIAVLMFGASGAVASFYGDERVRDILLVISASILVQGFENIGVVQFRKDLQFNKDFFYNVSVQIVSVTTSIALALHFRDYMALVYTQLIAATFRAGLSYVVSRYRPRLSLEKMGDIWKFSQWNMVSGVARYLRTRSSSLILGRFAPPTQVGFYAQAVELSDLATTDLVMPLSRVLVPGFAQLADDPPRATAAFLRSITAVTLIAAPVTIGIGLVAAELVLLWLGPQWAGVVPLMQVLVVFGLIRNISSISGNLLVVMGHIRLTAITGWLQALLFVVLALPAVHHAGALGVAWVQAGVSLIDIAVTTACLVRLTPLTLGQFLRAIWRPLAASGAMAAAVLGLGLIASGLAPLLLLLAKVAVGALGYSAAVLLLWRAAGRPDGVEKMILDRLRPLMPAGRAASRQVP